MLQCWSWNLYSALQTPSTSTVSTVQAHDYYACPVPAVALGLPAGLSQNGWFNKPGFPQYLEYLLDTWRKPDYASFLT